MGNSQGQPSKEQEAQARETSRQSPNDKDEGITGKIKKGLCCGVSICLKILYTALAIVIAIMSIALIAVSVSTAIATKMYSSDLSGRLVAMILLAVTAAITLSIIIYAVIAAFKNKPKHLHATSLTLIILAVIQALIIGVSVRVTENDELALSNSLIESIRLAQDDNPLHVKIWATTQSDLTCCGVFSPEDYRRQGIPQNFPSDVPISCCPSYDSSRSPLVQEKNRMICKVRQEYYQLGCKDQVLQVFRDTAAAVLGVVITLIILEASEAILGFFLAKTKPTEKGSSEKPKSPKSLEEGQGVPENTKDSTKSKK